MYGSVDEGVDGDGVLTMRIMGAVDVKRTDEQELTLEWDSSAANDMIADSTLAVVTHIDRSPASVKLTSGSGHSHAHEPHPHSDHEYHENPMLRIQKLGMFLEAHFGDVEYHMPDESDEDTDGREPSAREPSFLIQLDETDARINLLSMTVDSPSESLRKRVQAVLDMAVATVSSLADSFVSASLQDSMDTSFTNDDEKVRGKLTSAGVEHQVDEKLSVSSRADESMEGHDTAALDREVVAQ